MPLSIGKMTVNVSLCGAIPRSDMPLSPAITQNDKASAHVSGENVTTFDLNKQGAQKGAPTPLVSLKTRDRSTIPAFVVNGDRPTTSLLSQAVSQSEDSQDTAMPVLDSRPPMPVIEPPRWAVPAKGEARLEVSKMCVCVMKFQKCEMKNNSYDFVIPVFHQACL